jgi:hypothetical protein
LDKKDCGVHMGLMSARSSSLIVSKLHSSPAQISLPHDYHDYLTLCPASGRFVQAGFSNSIVVLDFF